MRDSDEFEQNVWFVERGFWSWFVTLKFPLDVSPKYTATRYEDEEEAFKVWFGEARFESYPHARCPVQFIRVIEKKETGDVLFHVLLRGIPEEMQRFWRFRWWELTSGGAWDRRLENKMDGLIRYFFYKKSYDVEFCIRWPDSTYCKASKAEY
jgi:hypothetical protein